MRDRVIRRRKREQAVEVYRLFDIPTAGKGVLIP